MEENNIDKRRSPGDELNRYQQVAVGLISQNYQAGPFQLKVISNSMLPFLRPGDLINVEPTCARVLKRGDIVVRLVKISQTGIKDDWIVHRLVGKSNQGWLTKGDNRLTFDSSISESTIFGRVIQIYQHERWIDLQQFPWNFRNRYLGWYHYWQGILYTYLRRLWGRLKSVGGEK